MLNIPTSNLVISPLLIPITFLSWKLTTQRAKYVIKSKGEVLLSNIQLIKEDVFHSINP